MAQEHAALPTRAQVLVNPSLRRFDTFEQRHLVKSPSRTTGTTGWHTPHCKAPDKVRLHISNHSAVAVASRQRNGPPAVRQVGTAAWQHDGAGQGCPALDGQRHVSSMGA